MAISAESRSIASPYWGLSTRMRGAVDACSNNQIAHSNALQRIGVVGQAHPTEHRQKDERDPLHELVQYFPGDATFYYYCNPGGNKFLPTKRARMPKMLKQVARAPDCAACAAMSHFRGCPSGRGTPPSGIHLLKRDPEGRAARRIQASYRDRNLPPLRQPRAALGNCACHSGSRRRQIGMQQVM